MTEDERNALIDVRDKLANGTYVHAPHFEDGEVPAPLCFNMNEVSDTNGCGTVACIGGWMADALLHRASYETIRQYVSGGGEEGDLRALFYPDNLVCWYEITSADAATAIDNMLTHGDPCWNAIRPDLVIETLEGDPCWNAIRPDLVIETLESET